MYSNCLTTKCIIQYRSSLKLGHDSFSCSSKSKSGQPLLGEPLWHIENDSFYISDSSSNSTSLFWINWRTGHLQTLRLLHQKVPDKDVTDKLTLCDWQVVSGTAVQKQQSNDCLEVHMEKKIKITEMVKKQFRPFNCVRIPGFNHIH